MYSFKAKIRQQIESKKQPIICFFDIDGTLFTPDVRLLAAPIFDSQTYSLLKNNNIPFIVITGRFTWNPFRDAELTFYGLPQPDGIIFAGGSRILLKKIDGKYEEDLTWIKGGNLLTEPLTIPDIPSFHKIQSNVYATDVRNLPVRELHQIIDKLKYQYKNTASIFYSESLIKKNTTDIFSGSIYVTPKNRTKEGAVEHVIQQVGLPQQLETYIFGDGSIDIPMLSMQTNNKIHIHGFLVHPTPLARDSAKKYPQITVLEKEGPQAILQILKQAFASHSKFSPAQNNSLRKFVELFDPLLDRLTNQSLSANDISLLGIRQVTSSMHLLTSINPIKKITGIYLYSFGNLTDILDGIRARRKGKTPNGQLVDGFADRTKEFTQLYHRGESLLHKDQKKSLQTFLTAISCALPSIARAQAEIQNIIVKERDNNGGSMIDRTKLLFASMFFQLINMPNKSFIVDSKIQQNNLATFKNRISAAPNFLLEKIQKDNLNSFQKEAFERWLLYVEIFQDENNIILETLKKYPSLQKEFLQKTKEYSFYLNLPINKLRKENNLEPFFLKLNSILNKLV